MSQVRTGGVGRASRAQDCNDRGEQVTGTGRDVWGKNLPCSVRYRGSCSLKSALFTPEIILFKACYSTVLKWPFRYGREVTPQAGGVIRFCAVASSPIWDQSKTEFFPRIFGSPGFTKLPGYRDSAKSAAEGRSRRGFPGGSGQAPINSLSSGVSGWDLLTLAIMPCTNYG